MKKLLAVLVYFGLVGFACASTHITQQQGEANQLQALQDDYNQRQAQAMADYIKQHDQEHPDSEVVIASPQHDDEDRLTKIANNDVLISNETK